MESSPPPMPDETPSCFGLFTCISDKCKRCRENEGCMEESNSQIVLPMLFEARIRIETHNGIGNIRIQGCFRKLEKKPSLEGQKSDKTP